MVFGKESYTFMIRDMIGASAAIRRFLHTAKTSRWTQEAQESPPASETTASCVLSMTSTAFTAMSP